MSIALIMQALSAPALQASVVDLEFAHTVLLVGCEPLDDAPILDLRIRKGVRRNGVALAIASARPSALDRNAQRVVRHAPGGEAQFLAELEAALRRRRRAPRRRASRSARSPSLLRDGGEDVVIVWSERIGSAAAAILCGSPSGSGSPTTTAPACSRFRRAPTAAAFARPA